MVLTFQSGSFFEMEVELKLGCGGSEKFLLEVSIMQGFKCEIAWLVNGLVSITIEYNVVRF